ncbi:phosphatidylinositol N-acetylglucosaminyltransferase SPT14 [Spizellomyces punctatus DAOM BR117]|uniref:Phosphatidylinositol N-acetylglucosaminyltransferase GPI3 subunit n=1 Tax=Spizellomyces punctatus (strain DAOM BR117) TaxID=645134 RepID=A0A0L0HD82_SPIPD|nr:phosphatidylinositol N-acetylglucosaminyltransferase SPT14 [Spizellomyces punctatus DAOM BR117]KNC98673.1 hypothetical protein SPPG_06357 [Spizellomyces punctatus DAOM BR117]|eukprot:XP_016606713.1 hypothetical protein SPPG_06357 [Spizellomyces punctatus DAOM BR117]
MRRLNICMVSDFFYPNMGGVEAHIYHLSQRLVRRGHKVIVVTHNYGRRAGVRYLTSGVKVYHIPHWLVYDQVSLPTVYSLFPLFRYIVVRERIDVVHGHGAFSSMCHEAILHARTMGLRACFTDHSLFGFEDASSILTNKLLKFTLSDIDHVICVSHTSKENTVLRASLDPLQVSVIPNAVVAADFRPNSSAREAGKITIVIASRLVYRKGVDLMVAVIPCICAQFEDVNFLIAGDGPKRTDLEQMQDKYGLQDRVKLLGAVDHARVRDVLVRGHIFLNTSLTEAFCIAIVEAACCGLLVVSTRVGGVPEVLPEDMVLFAEPDEKDLVSSLSRAIETIRTDAPNPLRFHQRVKDMYNWSDVAERTEMVYDTIMTDPHLSLVERLQRYHECGVYAGILACMIVALDYLIWLFLEWLLPREDIDVSPAFNHDLFLEICQKKITTRNDNETKQGTQETKGAFI